MNKKKIVNKRVQKRVQKKSKPDTIHLITDLVDYDRDTTITSFNSIEQLENFILGELESCCSYNFENGNDIVIRGDILDVKVTETGYKVKIK